MTVVQTEIIPEAQLKVRWRETYVSEGVNKALAVLDPGIYRGGYVMAQGAPNKTVKITPNGEQDSFYLWVEKTGGTALAVRYATDVTLDLSGQFTGPGGTIPTGGKTLYVYLNASYGIGSPTSAAFYVDTTLPSAAGNAIRLAKLTLAAGSTSIPDTAISMAVSRTDGSNYRMTAAMDRPVLRRVYKSFSAPAGTPPAFQITGKVYVPGGTGSWCKLRSLIRMGLFDGMGYYDGRPYMGNDNGVITAKEVWADSACTTTIAADGEGFVVDPWVELDLSKTDDTSPPSGSAYYWTRATARDFVTNDQWLENYEVISHADEVKTKNIVGTPTHVSDTSVQGALETVVAAVNDRMQKITAESDAPDPILIWRSHAIASDPEVTGQTISLYWGNALGFAVIVGGYLSGNLAYRAPIDPLTSVTMLRLSSNNQMGPMLLAKHGTFTNIVWSNLANWSAYTRVGNVGGAAGFDIGGAVFNVTALIANIVGLLTLDSGVLLAGGQVALGSSANYVSGPFEPGTGGNDTYSLIWQGGGTSAIKSRLYFGATGQIMVTSNARWVQGSPSKWMPDDDALDAKMLALNVLQGLQMYDKNRFTSGFATGWTAWDATIHWLDLGDDLSPVTYGSTRVERVPLGFGWFNNTGSPMNTTLYSEIHKTFRGSVDTITYVMSEQANTSGLPVLVGATSADGYGAMCRISTTVISHATSAYWHGIAVVTYL